MGSSQLSSDNLLLRTFVFYGAILLLKMLAMAFFTAIARMRNRAFANPEDAAGLGLKVTAHEDVERVRRAHLNDMENIYVFLILGLFYVLTKPKIWWATMLFRVFTGARILHTIVYLNGVRQPARALCYLVGQLVNIYMAVTVVLRFMD